MTWREIKEFLDSQIKDEDEVLYIDISNICLCELEINRYESGEVAIWS